MSFLAFHPMTHAHCDWECTSIKLLCLSDWGSLFQWHGFIRQGRMETAPSSRALFSVLRLCSVRWCKDWLLMNWTEFERKDRGQFEGLSRNLPKGMENPQENLDYSKILRFFTLPIIRYPKILDTTTVRKPELFPSSGEGRKSLLSWVP